MSSVILPREKYVLTFFALMSESPILLVFYTVIYKKDQVNLPGLLFFIHSFVLVEDKHKPELKILVVFEYTKM